MKNKFAVIILFALAPVLMVGALIYKNKITQNRPQQVEQLSNNLKQTMQNNTNTPTPTVDNFDYSGGITQLQQEIITQGEGEPIKTGETALVYYTGELLNGQVFDSNKGGEPYPVTLGENSVIQGWEQGLLGMKVGEVKKLTIPASLGYGEAGFGPIPGNATLVFEVELVEIQQNESGN